MGKVGTLKSCIIMTPDPGPRYKVWGSEGGQVESPMSNALEHLQIHRYWRFKLHKVMPMRLYDLQT